MAGFGYTVLGFGSGGAGKKLEGIDYLVVAGGGGGGAGQAGGGGGAGGLIASYGVPQRSTETITAPITVTVGGGSPATRNPQTNLAPNGEVSTFSTITAAGGGAAGDDGSPNQYAGQDGGSGGGGGYGGPPSGPGEGAGGSGNVPPVSPPQGNPGWF